MSLFSERPDFNQLDNRLLDAPALTPELISDVITAACTRLPSLRHTGRAAQAERLIAAGAWTDATLALVALELPQWQLRRLAYDDGEWHCALSTQREMPEWLDQSIEAHHADLAIAILRAFVSARKDHAPLTRSSVPATPRTVDETCEPMWCDHFA